MTLHISEIGVRLAVGGSEPTGGAAPRNDRPTGGAELSPVQVEEIVNRCVQDVLRTLRMLESR
jgi:hypothetical protein